MSRSRTIKQLKMSASTGMALLGLSGSALAQQDKPAAPAESRLEVTKTLQASTNEGDFAMARRWQKADDLMGKKVVNAAGEDLGKLKNIVVDANSGRALYGVLSVGGALGIGDKLFAVPWRSLSLGDDAKAFTLSVDKETLKNAQSFDKDQWPNFADERWATTTHAHYKQPLQWRSDAEPQPDISGVSYRDRWTVRPILWQKASDLTGKDIHNTKDDDLGRIADLIIDPDQGRVMYGVLSHRGRMFAIPWNALALSTNAKKLVLNVNKEQLTDANSFTNDKWPDFTNGGWAAETHRVYAVTPYWSDAPAERAVAP